jgi:hypothetical protein
MTIATIAVVASVLLRWARFTSPKIFCFLVWDMVEISEDPDARWIGTDPIIL